MLSTSLQTSASARLARSLSEINLRDQTVTLIGYGAMGRYYFQALQALKAGVVRICTRTAERTQEVHRLSGVQTISGGYSALPEAGAHKEALVIIATPIQEIAPALRHVLKLGYRRILCEKPVSLWSKEVEQLAEEAKRMNAQVYSAFNRRAYPAFIELSERIRQEGGVTSCTYEFTEILSHFNPEDYTLTEQQRWGIANSLHVISMAHGFIGLPQTWTGYRSGELPWHSHSVYVGSGLTADQVPFNYHADWGSQGRWGVEISTAKAIYRLCPLETLQRKTNPLGDWEEVPVETFQRDLKAGIVEEIAAMVDNRIQQTVRLPDLQETAKLIHFAEDIFGYSKQP
jgi:predicted dehydrogenase